MALLTIKNLSFRYPGEENDALQSINLEIEEGELVVLIGQSGCGKSTLIKQLKREIAPHGNLTGDLLYKNRSMDELDQRVTASEIGYVSQNPDNQIVTDKVWHELAFGLENIGLDKSTIRRRVAEMANFLGIQTWYRQKTVNLSGGQKQLLNLAAITVMQPKVLLLDEPTSQLDPIAASEFLGMLRKLNEELGLTIILVEHRLEDVLPIASRVVVMDEGSIIYNGAPINLLDGLPTYHPMLSALPSAMRIFSAMGQKGAAPLTIREGRRWLLNQGFQNGELEENESAQNKKVLLEAKDVAFRYQKDGEDILHYFNLQVFTGEFMSVIGGNGTGKSTALKVLSSLLKPYQGQVFLRGKKIAKFSNVELYRNQLAVLPQNPVVLFVEKTVKKELQVMADVTKTSSKLDAIINLFELDKLLHRHPYDLSGGEQQKVALAKLLLLEPQMLMLDEPTKGLDAHAKESLGSTLQALQQKGITILMVTHDIEFSAKFSDRCSLLFDGQIITTDIPRKFYSGNSFYTTAAHRLSKNLFRNAITCEDVVKLCNQTSVMT
ncbi:ABC transporter ATP-binding protein [Lysinibacillus sp. SGAir0095]|uniref:ABC transporter ATP-binding protein n=1 Tax=Lysinibacillus sp. SGAir0095 TaxID=2070463 RepID=UPI0010CD3098|nr:ABC transporter ATP-binding protein [Lysinibacillus sp. SGAir0095]QCR32102.1 cobalt ABC transporter ATP-binding protein [Lysinibacillus sp. SGAir0095]